nr:hypothetical protein [Tanacetum cinerariifolium]
MAPLPPRDQRHLWLYYQVNRVHILDFERLTLDIRQDLAERLRMEFILEFFSTYRIGSDMGLDVTDTLCFQLGGARRSMAWRQFILTLCLHTAEEMAEDRFGAYWDFMRGAPLYTYIRDLVQRLCHRNAKGRKSGARLSGGHFIGHLAHHFGLVSDDGEIGDDWDRVASGPERQQVVVAGDPEVAKDAPIADDGAPADPAPIQVHQSPPPPPAAGYGPEIGETGGGDARTYQAFDGTFQGSSPAIFERRTRQRTRDACTSIAPQQPDP